MNIVLYSFGKKKEKLVYQKILGSNSGQDYEKFVGPTVRRLTTSTQLF